MSDAGNSYNDDSPLQGQVDEKALKGWVEPVPFVPLPKPVGIRAKLSRALADIGGVAKLGENKYQHYNYQQAGDIFAKVQAALSLNGIAFFATEKEIEWMEPVQTKNEGMMPRVRVTMSYAFLDTEKIDGVYETLSFEGTGLGVDNTDKQITKAKTFALKYALKQIGLIGEPGDDPDEDSPGNREQPQACPLCGNVGALMQSQYNENELYCNKNRGGCGGKIPKQAIKAEEPPKPKAQAKPKESAPAAGVAPSAENSNPASPSDSSQGGADHTADPAPTSPPKSELTDEQIAWFNKTCSETNTLVSGLLQKGSAHSPSELKLKFFKEYVEPYLLARLKQKGQPKPNM